MEKLQQTEVTHDTLPKAVTLLLTDVSEIKRLLLERSNANQPEADQLLTIQQAAEFLNLSVPTLYSKSHSRTIPVSRKGKRLYFSRQELTDWVKSGKKRTVLEIEAEAENYLSNKKKK